MTQANSELVALLDDVTTKAAEKYASVFEYFDFKIKKKDGIYEVFHNDVPFFAPLTSFTAAFAVVFHTNAGDKEKLLQITRSIYKYEKYKNDMRFYKHCKRWDMYENAKLSAMSHLRKIRDSMPEKI